MHWDGTSWSRVPSPNPSATGDNVLSAIDAISADDIWAVGWHASGELDGATLTEHWDGSDWSVVLSPNPGHRGRNVLSGVGGVSDEDVWTVGSFTSTGSDSWTLVARWNGKRWSRPTSPNPGRLTNELLSVSAQSSKDVWAVGDYASVPGRTCGLIEHWNGRRWHRVPGPDLGDSTSVLTGVSADAGDDAWAVGYVESAGIQETLTLHWDGVTWTQLASPNPGVYANSFRGVAAGAPDSVWAVGIAFASANLGTQLITAWDGLEWHTY
jgi:hypothetical protein